MRRRRAVHHLLLVGSGGLLLLLWLRCYGVSGKATAIGAPDGDANATAGALLLLFKEMTHVFITAAD